jgi:hypothetical protein
MRTILGMWPLAGYLIGVFGGAALLLAWSYRQEIGGRQ